VDWLTIVGVLVVIVCLPRAVREIFPGGRLDTAARAVFRDAGMLPLFVVVGALVLVGISVAVVAEVAPDFTRVPLAAIPVVAVGGCLWVFERGIRAVRRYRRDEAAGTRGPDHPRPHRRRR
jgi:hypothetical protein